MPGVAARHSPEHNLHSLPCGILGHDVLVSVEQIVGIKLTLDSNESFEVRTIIGTHPRFIVVVHEVDISANFGMRCYGI